MKKPLLLTTIFTLLLVACTTQKDQYHPSYFGDLSRDSKSVTTPGNRVQVAAPAIAATVAESQNQPILLPAAALPATTQETPTEKMAIAHKKPAVKPVQRSVDTQQAVLTAADKPAESQPQEDPDTRESGDALLYFMSAMMALGILGLQKGARSKMTQLTRWAKANPKKAQYLIAAIQLPLLGLGLLSGHNLKELGYDLSNNMSIVFGATMLLGFLSVPFLRQRQSVPIPQKVFGQKLAYMAIAMSSLMMTTGFGNSIAEKYPVSVAAQALQSADQSIVSVAGAKDQKVVKSKEVKSKHKLKKFRRAVAAGSCALAVFLILLLIGTTCAGICLFIFGIAGLAESVGTGLLLVLAGVLVTYLSIMGIVKLSRWCKKDNT